MASVLAATIAAISGLSGWMYLLFAAGIVMVAAGSVALRAGQRLPSGPQSAHAPSVDATVLLRPAATPLRNEIGDIALRRALLDADLDGSDLERRLRTVTGTMTWEPRVTEADVEAWEQLVGSLLIHEPRVYIRFVAEPPVVLTGQLTAELPVASRLRFNLRQLDALIKEFPLR